MAQVNITEVNNLSANVSDVNLFVVISECNLVCNPKKLWLGVTRHACANKWMFTSYTPVENIEQLYLGNSTTKVEGAGKVVLTIT